MKIQESAATPMRQMKRRESNYVTFTIVPPKPTDPTCFTVTVTEPKLPKVRPVYTITEVPKAKALNEQSDKKL